MLDDAVTLVSWRSRPRTFVALMALYESNYLRLSSLVGGFANRFERLTGRHRSQVEGDCDLLLNVTDRSPYTTTLNLTYHLGDSAGGASVECPDMSISIYHDAHLVEAQEWAGS